MALRANSYPGRGFVIGLSQDGTHLIQAYWIMGRGENSRNRVFVTDKAGRVSTEAADPSKVKDPSLIIYDAMLETGGDYVVSNGRQTNDVLNASLMAESLENGLSGHIYEPDTPNFTPRITGLCSTIPRVPIVEIAILRKSLWGDSCERAFYSYSELGAGYGYCVTTYMGDGDPLPSFQGDPYLLPLKGSIDDVLELYWGTLNADNRVSLAVKFISLATGESEVRIINKYARVEAVV